MPAAVDTMAYVGEVPWHGLGTDVGKSITVPQMLKKAGIDWTVSRRTMYMSNGKEIPGFAALTRDSDERVLDIVGSRYSPIQNEQIFQFFVDFVKAGKAHMETAGSLQGGRFVWGLANLDASFEVSKGDKLGGYLLAVAPHLQGKSALYKTTAVRVVCKNTLAMALRDGRNSFRIHHRSEFSEVSIEEAKEALGLARDQLSDFTADAKKLRKFKISDDEALRILVKNFQSEDVDSVMEDIDFNANIKVRLIANAYQTAPGAEPGNLWGLLNGFTYYKDHMASRTSDKRMTNAWLGAPSKTGETFFETLKEMVQ